MGRWEPDTKGRLMEAALALFAAQGFDETTTAEIAKEAGVTERTFFRHFADKREVLFGYVQLHREAMVAGIKACPADVSPLDAVVEGLISSMAGVTQERARMRLPIILANPSLLERELLKMASLVTEAAGALRDRGVPEPAATLAAESGIAVYKTAYEAWATNKKKTELADEMRTALAQLKAAVAG